MWQQKCDFFFAFVGRSIKKAARYRWCEAYKVCQAHQRQKVFNK